MKQDRVNIKLYFSDHDFIFFIKTTIDGIYSVRNVIDHLRMEKCGGADWTGMFPRC